MTYRPKSFLAGFALQCHTYVSQYLSVLSHNGLQIISICRRSHMDMSRWLSIFCRDGFQIIRMCRRSHMYICRDGSHLCMCRIQIIFMHRMALVRLAMAVGFYCIHTHTHAHTHTRDTQEPSRHIHTREMNPLFVTRRT